MSYPYRSPPSPDPELVRTEALMDALFPPNKSNQPVFLPPPAQPKPRKGSFLNIKALHLRGRTSDGPRDSAVAASITPTINTSLSPANIAKPLPPITPPPSLPPLPSLIFRGTSWTECEEFIAAVRQRAFTEWKMNDPEWMLQLATASFSGDALRWLLSLDSDTQGDWTNLQLAMLEEYSDR